MNGREACQWRIISFIFPLLSNILLLQVLTLAQSDARDEGDWLIWASRVEPKTLNPISAENDVYCRWITRGNIFEPLMDRFETLIFFSTANLMGDGVSIHSAARRINLIRQQSSSSFLIVSFRFLIV